MNAQPLHYGLPISAKAMEVYRRLLGLHPIAVDDAISLTPLEMLVFAILSQRTTHKNAQQAFDTLRQKFPDLLSLCDAPIHAIESAISDARWPDLKASYIQNSLRHILGWRGGELNLDHLFQMSSEDASAWLERLPGVGRKTSASVLLFSTLRRAVLPVDTGHRRMMMRLGLLRPSASWDKAHLILQSQLPRDWSQREFETYHSVIKKHAQTYCDATQPRCAGCILKDLCLHAQTRLHPRPDHAPLITTKRRKSSDQTHPTQMCMLYD
ncbi:MAG: Fe-S cluster assembly protein HesB [Capsulimonas sp.]|uniref:endonuclease III domain-containing protein n=1 Tax=Capsulimonas sp. TaxID=2494211 RepID=UPI0032631B27